MRERITDERNKRKADHENKTQRINDKRKERSERAIMIINKTELMIKEVKWKENHENKLDTEN